jgi:hypothetical protein
MTRREAMVMVAALLALLAAVLVRGGAAPEQWAAWGYLVAGAGLALYIDRLAIILARMVRK